MLALYLRLPMVTTPESPWYSYLRAVYHNDVPLPFDLRNLECFYPGLLPTSAHLCAGKDHFSTPSGQQLLPQCDNATCSQWLTPAPHPSKRGWARFSSHVWTPLYRHWKGGGTEVQEDLMRSGAGQSRLKLTGRNFFVGFMQVRHRQFHANNSWVEVMRVDYSDPHHIMREGHKYGCWFWPMAGTGVFVNVKRTLTFGTTGLAARHFQKMLYGNVTMHDNRFAPGTRALQADSLQILFGNGRLFSVATSPISELIVAEGGCYDTPLPGLPGPCPPVPLRTGWNASMPCSCLDAAAPILNCRGSDE